jgi:hypothetical protein
MPPLGGLGYDPLRRTEGQVAADVEDLPDFHGLVLGAGRSSTSS